MNEFSEHGPVADPTLGDEEAQEPAAPEREAGTDPARGETDEHPQAETPPN